MSDGGGLKAADLYVSVGASIAPLVKDLNASLDAIEKGAKKIGEGLGKMAGAFGEFHGALLGVAGAAAGAVAIAAEHSTQAAKEVETLKMAFAVLGREVGDTFLPIVREMTTWVKTAIATWRGLDSGTKEHLVTIAKWAAALAVGTMALQKVTLFAKGFADGTVALVQFARPLASVLGGGLSAVASGAAAAFDGFQRLMRMNVGALFSSVASGARGLGAAFINLPGTISGLGQSFMSIVPKIAAVGLPVLAVAAAVAGLVLLAGSLYKNWDKLTFLISDSTAGITDSLADMGKKVASFFGGLWDGFKGFLLSGVHLLLDMVAAQVRAFARFLAPVTSILRMGAATKTLNELKDLTGDQMLEGLVSGAEKAGDTIMGAAKAAGDALASATKSTRGGLGSAISYGVKDSIDGVKEMGADLAKALHLDKLGELKDKLFGGGIPIGDPNSVSLPPEMQVGGVGHDRSADVAYLNRIGRHDELDSVMKAYLAMIQKQAAQSVESVTGGLVAAALKVKQHAEEMAQIIQDARDSLKQKLLGRLGDIVDVFDTFTTGMKAMAGAAMGGVLAVIGDLLTRSAGFKTLVEMVSNLLQMVADSLGQFLVPLQPLIGAIGSLVMAIMGVLTPILQTLFEAIDPFIPIIVMLGEVFTVLEPLFKMLASVISIMQLPMKLLVEVGLRVLFEAIKGLALGILYVAKGISGVWNGIVQAVQNVLTTLGNIEVFGAQPFAFLDDWAKGLEGAKLSTEGLSDSISKLKDTTWDAAKAKADETAAVLKNREAVDKATESLTNVPNTWKVALARFNAQDARTSSPSLPSSQPAASTTPSASTPATQPTQQTQPAISIDTINVSARDEGQALSALERKLDDIAFRSWGSRAADGSPWAGP